MLGSVSIRGNVEECLLEILDQRNNFRLSKFLSALNNLIIEHGPDAANIVLENQTACARILSLIGPTSTDSQCENIAIFIMVNIAIEVELHEEARQIVTSKLPYLINLLHYSCTLTPTPEAIGLMLTLRNDLNHALCLLARHDQYHELIKAHMRDLSREKLLDLLVLDAAQSTAILKIAFQIILKEKGVKHGEQLLKFLARFIKALENSKFEFQQFLFEALIFLVEKKYYAKIILDNFGMGYLLKFLAVDIDPTLQEFALSAIVNFRAIKEGDSIVVLNNRLLMPALIVLLDQPINQKMLNTLCAIFLEAIMNRHNQEFFNYASLLEAICKKFADGVESHMQLFYLQVLLAFSKGLPEHQKIILENETIMAYLIDSLVNNDDNIFNGAASLLEYLLENNHELEIFNHLSSKELMLILNMDLVDYKNLIDHVVKNIEFEPDGELQEEFLMEMLTWLNDTEAVRLYALRQLVILTKGDIPSINFVCVHGIDKLINCLSLGEDLTAQRAVAVLVNIIQDSENGAATLAEFDSLISALGPLILQDINPIKQKYAILIAYSVGMIEIDKIAGLIEENIIKAVANFLVKQEGVYEQASALNLLSLMAIILENPFLTSYIEELKDIFTNADFTNSDHLAAWNDICEGLCEYPSLDPLVPLVERQHSPISFCDSVESDLTDEEDCPDAEENPHSESAATTLSCDAQELINTPSQNSVASGTISAVFLRESMVTPPRNLSGSAPEKEQMLTPTPERPKGTPPRKIESPERS